MCVSALHNNTENILVCLSVFFLLVVVVHCTKYTMKESYEYKWHEEMAKTNFLTFVHYTRCLLAGILD